MDIRQILITAPIINAIKILNPNIDVSMYLIQKGEQGFILSRLIDIDKKITPIIIKPIPNMGRKINGTIKQVYEIIDGRHRIAYAILQGMTTLPVIIQED
jgi:hypothetical protein